MIKPLFIYKLSIFLLIASDIICLVSCSSHPGPERQGYRWILFQHVPRNQYGDVTGDPSWSVPLKIKTGADTFIVYKNYDSILMCTPSSKGNDLFKKVNIPAKKWKPKPNYGSLLFAGTYIVADKDHQGVYFSYYLTKDRSSIMQVMYTNPGNMMDALLFSKDSINILQKEGIRIDPRDETVESEEARLAH